MVLNKSNYYLFDIKGSVEWQVNNLGKGILNGLFNNSRQLAIIIGINILHLAQFISYMI